MNWKKWLPWAGWGLALVFATLYFNTRSLMPKPQPETSEYVAQEEEKAIDEVADNMATTDVPRHAIKTLEYVLQYNRAPEGYVGGRKFYNREKELPKSENGEKINYREWDVWPKEKGKNRGPERLVTGDNKTAYYTQNHYKTFTQIK